ncbi:MAG: hypothetical protein ABI873_18815 [Marmoricola sp.]
MSHTPRRLLGAATAAAVLAGVTQLPVFAAPTRPTTTASQSDPKVLLDSNAGLSDLDIRGRLAPSSAQRSAARSLGGLVRWNSFGTPASIAPTRGSLGKVSSSDAPTAARSWLRSHAGLFGMSSAQLGKLVLVNNQALAGSNDRAVLFRQDFGGPAPAVDSMVTVGIGGGAVQYVSSSLARTTASSVPAPALSPAQAWQKAAANIGRAVTADKLGAPTSALGWNRFKVAGFAQEQLVRLRSLAYADGTVRPVFEANVVDAKGGSSTAYTLLVDAVSGKVLVRQNKVDQRHNAYQFQGAVTATTCGPRHQFELTDANTKAIVANRGGHQQRHRGVDLQPGRRAADQQRQRHQPRGGHLLGGQHPQGHLLDAGVPLPEPDRAVQRRG